MTAPVIALDLGGTWIKGLVAPQAEGGGFRSLRQVNPLHSTEDVSEFVANLGDFCLKLTGGAVPRAIVASTAGEVAPSGKGYICAGAHLGVMGSAPWVERLSGRFGCPVSLINDSEAFLLGVAHRGELLTDRNVGALVIGTGLGLSVVRCGRWWKPARRLVHFGSIPHLPGDYNSLLGASRILPNGVMNRERLASYLDDLAGVIAGISNLLFLDQVILGGGVIDALQSSVNVSEEMDGRVGRFLLPGLSQPSVIALRDSNRAVLEGALSLSTGLGSLHRPPVTEDFEVLTTEQVAKGPSLEKMSSREMVEILIEEEAAAAARFSESRSSLQIAAEWAAAALVSGGRIAYLGAGTSGRIGALDAVEIPCTFGLPPDRFVAVIAGGIADAALSIEDQCEEDESSVADLLLLNLSDRDLVIGLSASGSAFFVRSGLAFARMRRCRTILIHESEAPAIADLSIRLHSGPEMVRGSTRMKAGTATKKALNILSTCAMALLGKVYEGEMIDLQCTNAKLRARAVRILSRISGLTPQKSESCLAETDFDLRAAVELFAKQKSRAKSD